jgi:two-component system NtrC family sensor kinase
LSETVKSSTRYDMLLNRRESLHQIINTIGRQDGIEKVRIFNKDGGIIFSTDSADIGGIVDKRAEACYACHSADQPLESLPISNRTRIFTQDDERVLGIISPIYNEPGCSNGGCHAHDPDQKVLGVIDITIPLAAADAEQRANRNKLILLTILVIVVISTLIYFLAGRLVLRPVSKIFEATRRVASGDLEHSIPVEQSDEIGRLAESFNEMTRNLSEARTQLFQTDKLASVGRLAAGVAHEINNPLTGVLTYSSFLLSKAGDDEDFKNDLEVIVRETKRCREIVKGLLDFSRQSTPEKRRTQVNEVILRSASIVQNQLSIQKARIDLSLGENLPPILADVNQLEQVLVNLFVNAGDSMGKKGGTISVKSLLVDGNVEISIQDTGCGIPHENLDKIFDPFFTTKGASGTGLGLAIVWGIIEEHGGRILVDSEVDVGTTFRIQLPAANQTTGVAS